MLHQDRASWTKRVAVSVLMSTWVDPVCVATQKPSHLSCPVAASVPRDSWSPSSRNPFHVLSKHPWAQALIDNYIVKENSLCCYFPHKENSQNPCLTGRHDLQAIKSFNLIGRNPSYSTERGGTLPNLTQKPSVESQLLRRVLSLTLESTRGEITVGLALLQTRLCGALQGTNPSTPPKENGFGRTVSIAQWEAHHMWLKVHRGECPLNFMPNLEIGYTEVRALRSGSWRPQAGGPHTEHP